MSSVPASFLYRIDDLELDTAQGCLRRAGREIHLKPKAFQILVYLVAQRDRLVSKQELMQQFWKDTAVTEDVLAHAIAEVRRALGDSSRDPQYLRTVPKRGYRFVAAVREVSIDALVATEQITTIEVTEEYSDEAPQAPLLPPPPRPRRRLAVLVASAAVCVAVAVAYWAKPAAPVVEPGIRTAIIQFENRSGTMDTDWLRDGLPDMLATSLSASPRIALITPDKLRRGMPESSGGTIRHRDALAAARQAGAQAMITGAFVSFGGDIRVDTQLYDVRSDRLLGGESLTATDPTLLLGQFDRFAAKLAVRLGAPVAGQTHLAEVMTNNLEAYRLYSLGLERTRQFQLREAIAFYEKAVALDPGFAMAYARIGFTYSSSWGRPEDGKPYLEKAYRLSDRLTPRDRMFIRAWYALACRDYGAAERAYREIISAFPLEGEIYYALGRLISGEGRPDEALKVIQRGLAIEPDNPELHNILTGVYFELGQRYKALESAQRYVSLTGEPNAYDTLAAAYQRAGRYDEAQTTYLKALQRKPDFDIAINHLGNLYFQLGRYREALNQYREYTRVAPSNKERIRGHLACAWVYWKKGDLANAERETAEASRLHGREVRESLLFRADRGTLTFTDNLRHQLIDASTGADRGAPENQRIPYFIAGYVALRDHKTDEALDDFRAVLRQPGMSWFVDPLETCLADALLELGRFDDAIAEYKRVLNLNPNYAMARYRLGLALDRKGLGREARAEFTQFLSIWKDADADIPEFLEARRHL